jgi:hypothetical protein
MGQSCALFVECNWTNRPVGIDGLRDLERALSFLAIDATVEGLGLLPVRPSMTSPTRLVLTPPTNMSHMAASSWA